MITEKQKAKQDIKDFVQINKENIKRMNKQQAKIISKNNLKKFEAEVEYFTFETPQGCSVSCDWGGEDPEADGEYEININQICGELASTLEDYYDKSTSFWFSRDYYYDCEELSAQAQKGELTIYFNPFATDIEEFDIKEGKE